VLQDEERPVLEQHAIDLGHVADRARGLPLVVVPSEQHGSGLLHQSVDRRRIVGRRDPERYVSRGRRLHVIYS
jgi:hypothetical protein